MKENEKQNRNEIQNPVRQKEEEKEYLQKQQKKTIRTLVITFAAFIAIIIASIAWFVYNTTVSETGSNISAKSDIPFKLASTGVRQSAEVTYLKDDAENNLLTAGTEENYKKYIDVETGNTENFSKDEKEQTLYTGSSELAWYLNTNESLYPGEFGTLEFYLIPQKKGMEKVNLTFTLSAYVNPENNTSQKAQVSEDDKLQSLVSGHILLFQNLSESKGYSGWLETDAKKGTTSSAEKTDREVTITAPSGGTFQENMPYKVTLYWVWPRYFRNYIYTQRSTQEDLFTDQSDTTENGDRSKLLAFVKNNPDSLFYDAEGIKLGNSTIGPEMSDSVLDMCSKYYNQADEYIGTHADYVYVRMDVSE